MLRLFLSLEPLVFEFVSYFDIRISNFVARIRLKHGLKDQVKADALYPVILLPHPAPVENKLGDHLCQCYHRIDFHILVRPVVVAAIGSENKGGDTEIT